MNAALALILALMPPAAARHHDQAMAHYEAGRHAEAFAEFQAAYAALTDPRADRDEREQVLATMRGMLLVEHEQTGDPKPLCRLHTLLGDHLAALRTAHPEASALPEVVQGEQRLAEVDGLLGAFPPDTCPPAPRPQVETPPPPPTDPPAVTTAPAPASPAPAASPAAPAERTTAKPLRVAGGVTLGVSGALLGVMALGIAGGRRQAAAAARIDAAVVGDITPEQHVALRGHLDAARAWDRLAIAGGCAAAGTAILGVALLLVAHKRAGARPARVSVAPWWLSSGTGVTLRLVLP